ncbi:hypothetical protein EUTSA_v10017613mg, partial [Eutrema salsugineum]
MPGSKKRKLDRVDFLGDYVVAFKNGIHTDVIVKPGGDGPGIPAHKAVLAVKSKVFSYMLDSDECKISTEKSITVPDLSYEELNALLKFFYTGILRPTNKHIRALYIAAYKYDIPYLQDLCRDHLISSLSLINVLDVLELSTIPSDDNLRYYAASFVLLHREEIVYSKRYKSFVRQNPDLSLYITKSLVTLLKYHRGRF